MILNKLERNIMKIIYELCDGRNACLISPNDIISRLPKNKDFDEKQLKKILKSLELDDYFDLIDSDRKGEVMYCINIHIKGEGFKREGQKIKKTIAFKISLTIGLAVLSFIVGRILISIF